MNIKEAIKKTPFFGIASFFKTIHIFEFKLGHFKSLIKQKCIDAENNFLPWYSYPAIDFIKNLDLSDYTVFEYGSGYSTIFWSGIAKQVVSIEGDKIWYNKIKDEFKKDNIRYIFADDPEKYTKHISNEKDNFDIIIIDGFWRYKCLKHALKKLSNRGFIIFDNSDWAKKSCKLLNEENFTQIDFIGFAPSNNHRHSTSIFLKQSSILKRKDKNGAINFVGGLDLNVE